MFLVRLKPSAQKILEELPERDEQRISTALIRLTHDPFFEGKRLKGKYRGFFSMRVWPHRVIYAIHTSERLVIVIRIGQRQAVYK